MIVSSEVPRVRVDRTGVKTRRTATIMAAYLMMVGGSGSRDGVKKRGPEHTKATEREAKRSTSPPATASARVSLEL